MSDDLPFMPNLKDCPFTGTRPRYQIRHAGGLVMVSIFAPESGIGTPEFETGREAARWWNGRKPAGKGAPAGYDEIDKHYAGIAAVELASHAMTEGDGGGDYTIADGDSSGRKLTVTAQSGVSVTATGTATHVVLADDVGSELLYVTTCTSQALTSGGSVDVPAFDIEIADPS